MEDFYFRKAEAIWALDRELEKNCELAFRVVVTPGQASLYLAASTIYRIWVNGDFVGAGPARTSHGFYCVDKVDLKDYLSKDDNIIVIEVTGFNVNSYDTLDQPSFLTAEIVRDGRVIACTGDDTIKIFDLHQRVQRVQRYSFQRAFCECYRLKSDNGQFYKRAIWNAAQEQGIVQCKKKYLVRGARMPQYERLQIERLLETGAVGEKGICTDPLRDRSYWGIGETLKGYLPQELEEHLSDEAQNLTFIAGQMRKEREQGQNKLPLRLENGYGLYSFPFNATGFLHIELECDRESIVYLLFDEILSEGKVDFMRLTSCNCFKYMLDIGRHNIITFAPYTMKYIQVVVEGSARINELQMIEYKHPPVSYQVKLPEDDTLKTIYQAALESYLANAVDVFTDCPSRERAGWLCDSFFTARVEYVLTGESVLERTFLENYIRPERFEKLPKGMLPMCYPADHLDGNFIPNWAMWFVLELEEYVQRSNDWSLIEAGKTRVYELIEYFKRFENEYGLLENLEKWIFVEWSRANDDDVVQDVNFPTNMLYMRMLKAAADLYEDEGLAKKAQYIRTVIRGRSRKEIFYTDNEQRVGAKLVNPNNCTEVCQYYAFFTGVATKHEDPILWNILCEDFGYRRKETGKYPEVAFANAFIGNYLRVELLYRDRQYEKVIDSMKGYFSAMAKQTGTLWEHDSPLASCNHGFASHVIYWLAGIYQTKRMGDNG